MALLSILQALRLIRVVYKSIKVHRQSQDLIMSIQKYLKYKYIYENAGFLYTLYGCFQNIKNFH